MPQSMFRKPRTVVSLLNTRWEIFHLQKRHCLCTSSKYVVGNCDHLPKSYLFIYALSQKFIWTQNHLFCCLGFKHLATFVKVVHLNHAPSFVLTPYISLRPLSPFFLGDLSSLIRHSMLNHIRVLIILPYCFCFLISREFRPFTVSDV